MASSAQSTILSILAAAREIEIFGIQFYSKVTTCITDENGKAIMRSLGADERQHKETIEEVMEHLSPGLDLDEVEPERELLDIVPKKVFPFPPEGTCLTMKDEIRAVEIGIDVEIASVKMYNDENKEHPDNPDQDRGEAQDPSRIVIARVEDRWELVRLHPDIGRLKGSFANHPTIMATSPLTRV